MKTGFVTDSFSTLAGLASVAYGDVEYFRDVQNQIYQNSPTRAFDGLSPSTVLESFFGLWEVLEELILNAMEEEYQKDNNFTDYIDIYIGPDWKKVFPARITQELKSSIDYVSTYNVSFLNYLRFSLQKILNNETIDLIGEILENLIVNALKNNVLTDKDANLITQIASNNPLTKISQPPPDTIIPLERDLDISLDYRGVSFDTGYLSLRDYYDNYAYPSYNDDGIIPPTFRESLMNGYVGYLPELLLEPLINPTGAETISNYNVPYGTVADNTVLGAIDKLNPLAQSDRDIYEISLMGPRINGMLDFNPSTMSNGDLFDKSLITNFEKENKDKEKGLPSIARNFTSAY